MLKIGRNDGDEAMAFRTTIKVLILDNNKDLLIYVSDFLKSHSFEVTCAEDAGSALRILSQKDTFDIMLIDSHLNYVDVITFLWLIKDMNILSIVMREEADDDFLLQVIKNGAFLVIKRPLTNDVVDKLRQHVIRERIRKLQQDKMFHEGESIESETVSFCGKRKGDFHTIPPIQNESCSAKKKICLEWTKELHAKFLNAVHTLGEGRCFPREIRDTMKVPGLTRMQVASHLQKCREDGWNLNGKRGASCSSRNITSSTNIIQEAGLRRFGRMPTVAKHVDNQEEITTYIDASFSSNGVYADANHMNNQSFSDSSLMNGFGFQNNGQEFSMDSGEHSYNYHTFPQYNHASDDFFDFGNDIDGNESLTCLQLNALGTNHTHISEQIHPYYDLIMPNQGTSWCNNQISQ